MGQVAQLGTGEVAKIKSDAFQKDMTFMQTVSFDPATSKANNESAAEQKKAEPRAEGSGDGKAESKGPQTGGGSQTLESIGANVETNAKEAPKPMIGDLKLPGTFTPDIPQQRPIDQLNGRLVNLKVRVCPSGGC